MAQQGSLDLLNDPVAKTLLAGLHLDGWQSESRADLVSLDRRAIRPCFAPEGAKTQSTGRRPASIAQHR
jgi:hypothetical protein